MSNKSLGAGSAEPILVSACLLGLPTRYDGKTKRSQAVMEYLKREDLLPIPFCPEQLAGMPTPREKSFFQSGDGLAVLNGDGQVVSEAGQLMNDVFCRGAKMSLQIARLCDCHRALLKERSPSCGVHEVYLGGSTAPGSGVTSALLIKEGLEVISEQDI